MSSKDIIVIHGGAGNWEENRLKRAIRILRHVGEKAYEALLNKGAVDAVITAINMLEESEVFNAGYGSALNLYGEVQVDASIMLGNGQAGAIASLKGVKNAVTLAKIVMEQTNHVLLTSPMGDYLAIANNLKVDPNSLISEYRYKQWEKAVRYIIDLIGGKISTEDEEISSYIKKVHPKLISFLASEREILEKIRRKFDQNGNTVGAVAFDRGTLVAATSTGGTFLKLPGRIGDTPLIGAGTYAENNSAAVSATGIGEHIMKVSLTHYATRKIRKYGAKKGVVEAFKNHLFKPEAGIIAIDRNGNWGIAHTTKNMPCAVVVDDSVIVKSSWIKIF